MKSRIDHDNPLTATAKKWKKDQGIESLTIDELLKKTKDKKVFVSQKVDGQSAILEYKNGTARFGSLGGRVMSDFPLTKEIESLFEKLGISQARIMGEMAGTEDGKILPFKETQSLIKNPDADKGKIHWYPYQILEMEGEEVPDNFKTYVDRWPGLKKLFKGTERIHPVEAYVGDTDEIKEAWKKLVEKGRNEGIVVRTSDNKVYKSKPIFTYDLVILAVGDKKGKNWPKGKIGNVLGAFMDNNRVFRTVGEIGTGWNDEEKEELFKWAQKNKVDEDDTYVWVKPERVMEVQWERSNIKEMPAYKYSGGKYEKVDKKPVGTVVKPRFIRYREDKSVTPSDLRLEQIPDWEERKKMGHRIAQRYLKQAVKPLSFNEFIQKHTKIMNDDPAPDQHFPPQRAYMLYQDYKRLVRKNDKKVLRDYHGIKKASNKLYHGTGSGFKDFGPVKKRSTGNPTGVWGVFFTGLKDEALRYITDFHHGRGTLVTAEVSLSRPYRMSMSEFNSFTTPKDLKSPDWASMEKRALEFKKELQKKGHDGIIIGPGRYQETVAFDPKNIKIIEKEEIGRGKNADYPDHPEEIVISKKEHILGGPAIKEIDIWTYYEGVKEKLLPELKGRDLFIVVKPNGKPVYIRHPYGGDTEYIRINNLKDYEEYHSGRTVEYHPTTPAMTPWYIVDFDPAEGTFDKARDIAKDVAEGMSDFSEVSSVEVRYTGKRGFHILGKLKRKKPVDQARKDLKEWLKERYGDRDDLVIAESPKGSQGALGLSPMKLNGGHVAKYSMRVSGLCCVEVPISKLGSFKKEMAQPAKVFKEVTGKKFAPKIKEAAFRVMHGFLEKESGYDRDRLKPGYKGKFLIGLHKADRAGDHWDVRLEFPKEGSAPVYRSFVDKKMELPTKGNKVYLVETEDHTMAQGEFTGTIPEGEYGAGEVSTWDKGTYELLDVEGDKKYVIDFKGEKLKGTYALVKYKNGYLWVKAGKEASVIDYVRPTLHPGVWDLGTKPPQIRKNVKSDAMDLIFKALEKGDLKKPMGWIDDLYVVGSICSYNYREDGDFDIDLKWNPDKFRSLYPKSQGKSDQDLHDLILSILDKYRDEKVPGTELTYSFLLLNPGESPISDGAYDLIRDRWVRGPVKIPVTFDPDEAFIRQRMAAAEIVHQVYTLISDIYMAVRDFRKIDQYVRLYGRMKHRRVVFYYRLKELCHLLAAWRTAIWDIHKRSKDPSKARYPAYSYSLNWDADTVIFKYIARYGCHEPVILLYEMLEGNPYLGLIKRFMPEDAIGRLFK